MTSEWRAICLGDICELRAGTAFPPQCQGKTAGDYPFIKVSDMDLPLNHRRIVQANHWVDEDVRRQLGANIHPAGATVFAKIGIALTLNRRRILTRPTIIDNNMMSAAPKTSVVDAEFLFYLLSTIDFNEIVSGTAVPYLSTSDLARLEVRLPPLPEQRAIAHILGTLDDKIELNRRMSETLEQMARAIFKAWFVDFEPVRAKMEGRWRRGESLPGLPAHLYDLFPDRLVDSELGEIPEGWEVKAMREAFEIVDGRALPAEFRADDAPFMAYGANGPIGRVKEPSIWSPCIILGKIGTCGALHRSAEPCWVSNNAFAIFAGPARSLEFAWHTLKSVDFASYVGGSANPYMPLKNFGHHKVLVPPPALLDHFELVAGTLRQRQDALHRESRTLGALRDALLPKLIRGEIRVKDVERFLKERGL